jgi:predicted O-methyltransferase YrrM
MKKALGRSVLVLGSPFTLLSTLWLKFVRRVGIGKIEDHIFMMMGVLPVHDHYYQPLVNPRKHLTKSLREDRELPGIDFNIQQQLGLLSKFHYNDELLNFPLEKTARTEFYYNNGSYCSGDAEYLYNIVRHFKPRKIIEIGSGASTLMVQNAVRQNRHEDVHYQFQHICIEPYEQPWLEKQQVELIRKRVETIDKSFFGQLEANDILFIDSSHIIRPQGDVLFEYLEILPILNPGVIVHVHDIFMPKDYPNDWVFNHFLWNEQYLLEAFLTFNTKFKIIGALNYLSHHHRDAFMDKSPIFAKQSSREIGAFWMVKV